MLIVPKSIRNEIIISLHCEWYIGHCGIFKTIQRICDNYWQPFVKDDVTNYASTYKICLSIKIRRRSGSKMFEKARTSSAGIIAR